MGSRFRSYSFRSRPKEPRNGALLLKSSELRMIKLCDINSAAIEKLPGRFSDKSGIGVHYTDAFLKPMNTALPDGTRVTCKRKGLKINLAVGTRKGEGLMRRLEVGADPTLMLRAALAEAGRAAGVELEITGTEILIGVNAA